MAKRRKHEVPVEHHWVCEDCGSVYEGADPPDFCIHCRHEYFENLADIAKGADIRHPNVSA